jgi:hypothetical protein
MLLAFPAVLLAVLAVLVGAGITGSSSGILNQFFESHSDPRLIAGSPQAVRSDEWLVQTPLVISQIEQGLPRFNQNLPGGTDSTVQSDLPSRDWSMIFRPHLAGFLFLSEDSAMSLRWWLPGFALMASCYAFFLTIRPRSPVSAAVISVGFFFAPFFQWWYLPVTLWPAAWCFVVMTAAVWLLRSDRRRGKILWSALAGYLTVTVAIGVYVPFMVPALLMSVAFVVGLVLTRSSAERVGFASRLKALIPLIASGAVATAVVAAWVATRLPTIERFSGTVYPGQRLSETGAISRDGIVSLWAGPVSRYVGVTDKPLDLNASEASSFILVGLVLFVPLLWHTWIGWRKNKTVDWLVVVLFAFLLLVVAYLVLPGWDAVAHLLLLDRSPAARIRLGIGLLSIVMIAVYASRYDEMATTMGVRQRRVVIGVTAALAVAMQVLLVVVLAHRGSSLVVGTWTWVPGVVAFVLAVYFFARQSTLLGALGLLAVSVFAAGGVNPLYVGAYDLNDTTLVRHMKALPRSSSANWLGVGGTYLPNVVLEQSGLHSYNGFQSAPSPEMWTRVDPANKYPSVWNRLASVSWYGGPGAPLPTNPQADAILVNFDSCSAFAQRYVTYVLSDGALRQNCLSLVETVKQGPSEFSIYRVSRSAQSAG